MPDDIKVLAATGDDTVAPPVATDLVGGKHYQKVKFGWGVNDSWVETADTDGVRVPVGGGQIGLLNETAPGTDTAAAGLNGRLQRIAQRITSLIALLPTALTPAGALKDGSAEAVLTASVASGQTVQGTGVDLAGLRNWGLMIPSTFDGSQIQFQMSDTLGGTYLPVYDITNFRVVMTVSASRYYDVPGELLAIRFLKIETVTAQGGSATDFLIIGKS